MDAREWDRRTREEASPEAMGLTSAGSGIGDIECSLPAWFLVGVDVEGRCDDFCEDVRFMSGGMPMTGSGGRGFLRHGSRRAVSSLRIASRSLGWRFGGD